MRRREVMVHVRRGEEFLVLHRVEAKGGYWHTVAGGVEAGESWEDAARRELLEEVGLDAAVREIGRFSYVREAWEPQPGLQVDARAYAAAASSGWEPTLEGEHDEYRWCTLADAEALLAWPEPKELLHAV